MKILFISGTSENNLTDYMNDLTLHFGLGDHTGQVELEIMWPYTVEKQRVRTEVNRVISVIKGND